MTITTTIQDMFIQSDFIDLIIMGVVFILMVVMLVRLGRGVEAKFANERPAPPPVASAAAASSQNDAVTAAISAAVNEYRKNNKS